MAVKRHRTQFDVAAEDRTKAAFDSVERNLGRVNNAAQRMGQTFRAVIGATVLAGLGRESLRAALEAEQASNRLTAVLRATGGAAGYTKRQLDEMADSLAESTQFDDESLRNAQAALLKFGNIQGQVFKDGLRLSADLAAFMGTNVPEAAQMIGKSLQSPTEGLMMMERQFGKLTEAEEKHIENLVRQGRAVEAQNAVLDLWQQKIGGTAELMNTGLTKATGDLGKAWNEFMEEAGKAGNLLNETLGGATQVLKDIKSEMQGVRTPLRDLVVDTLELVTWLRHVPGLLGQIGAAAEQQRERIRLGRDPRVTEGRIGGVVDWQAAGEGWESAAAAGFRPPVRLGGKTGNEAEAKAEAERVKRLREEDIRNLVRGAEEIQDEADKLIYTWDKAGNRIAVTGQEFRKMQEEEQRVIDFFVESAELSTQQAEAMIYTWDRAGNRIEMTADAFEELAKQQKKNEEYARDLGFTFSSAFEDAIVGGKKLSEVLKGLEQDIVRIIIRKAVTEPFAGAITSAIARGFASNPYTSSNSVDVVPRAGGGDVAMGRPYFVGEEGPELFVPGRSGTIVPNDAMGGMTVTINQSIHVDSRSDQASIMAAMHAAKEQAKAEIARSIRNGNRTYRSDN